MKLSREYRNSLKFLFQWLVISITAGVSGSLIVAFFFTALKTGSQYIRTQSTPYPIWTIGGAVLSGLLFYRISPTASGDGIPSYINGVLEEKGRYSFRETFAKMGAALLALSTLSFGGILGPSGRVSAGINSRMAQVLIKTGILGDQRRIAAVCGMAAAVGAIFHSPIGGGIFAVEVLQRSNMRYRDLFPSVLSSSVAVYIYSFLPLDTPLNFPVPGGSFDNVLMPPILITAFGAAFIGKLYTVLFYRISRLFRKGNRKKTIMKLFTGSALASSLLFVFSPDAAGNFGGIIKSLISVDQFPVRSNFYGMPDVILYILFITVIILASSLSIASGISVGLTSPSIVTGLFVGAFFARFFGYGGGEPEYFFFLVAGFSGLLSSTINVPIASAVMAVECFGSSYGFCAGVSSVIGFQVNRHHTLYDPPVNIQIDNRGFSK